MVGHMHARNYKVFTRQARIGIKGEAFFESLLSEYSLTHKIVGSRDVGIDFICEWVFGDKPTGVLFAVQVKTFSGRRYRITKTADCSGLNGLEEYKISNSNLKVSKRTIRYWKWLGIPVYLFAIHIDGEYINCYYKRYTGILTKDMNTSDVDFYSDFYKVNDRNSFIAFTDLSERKLGFARDLFIDCMRWNYCKGSIAYMNPRDIGLYQFPEENTIFPELFDDYRDKINLTYRMTRAFLSRVRIS